MKTPHGKRTPQKCKYRAVPYDLSCLMVIHWSRKSHVPQSCQSRAKVGPVHSAWESARSWLSLLLQCESRTLPKLPWASVSHCEEWGHNKALYNPILLSSLVPLSSILVSVSTASSLTLARSSLPTFPSWVSFQSGALLFALDSYTP